MYTHKQKLVSFENSGNLLAVTKLLDGWQPYSISDTYLKQINRLLKIDVNGILKYFSQ